MNKKLFIVLAFALIAILMCSMTLVDAGSDCDSDKETASTLSYGRRKNNPYKKYTNKKKYYDYDNDKEVASTLGRGKKWYKKYKKYRKYYDDKEVASTLGRGFDYDDNKYKGKRKYYKKKYHKYPRKYKKNYF
ncbi:hypothetical protein ABK040_002139 [Willaertia magna]